MTWLDVPADHPFGIQHLPYGSVSTASGEQHAAVLIGEFALSLTNLIPTLAPKYSALFAGGSLDVFLASGSDTWHAIRRLLIDALTNEANRGAVEGALLPLDLVTPVLAFTVADYVDFYASENHARNVGRIFRPDSEPLTPNWKHLPIGYHSRSGTVVVSGTNVRRPSGQRRRSDGSVAFGPSQRLDVEAELGYVVGVGSELGSPVSVSDFESHVFGVCLLNDWSARDIQAWEYVPLGPFLGKSFATSVAAWITPLAALEAARTAPPLRDPQPLPYLDDSEARWALDVVLEVRMKGELISRPPYKTMYWTAPQMLAHMTVNGASLRPGDLFASGTVSGSEPDQRGSLLELTWGGREPLKLEDGSTRSFLEDGDEVVMTATAPAVGGGRIGLAEVRGRIVG